MTFKEKNFTDVSKTLISVCFIGDIHSTKKDWYLHHQRSYDAPMQTFLPPSNPPSYHLLPHPGGSQNGRQNYQYSDSMDPGPSDASLRTFHGRTMSYDTHSSSEGLNQNGGPSDCVVWPHHTSANKKHKETLICYQVLGWLPILYFFFGWFTNHSG